MNRRTFLCGLTLGTLPAFTAEAQEANRIARVALLDTSAPVPALVLQSTYINAELKRVPLQAGMTTPWMDVIAASVPKSQAKMVPNAGHFTMIDAAQMVSEENGKFAGAVP